LPSQITRKATYKARAAPTKSHLTDTAEILDASEEPPVLLPGLLSKNKSLAEIQGGTMMFLN
tara:strand:- start:337 stop:522 length:186 start_codon:yes stop_codon:yes gene_type:complete